MKTFLLFVIASLFTLNISAQTSCSELMNYVKSESYGSTYYSYSSDAISQVTFYEVTDKSYNTFYFAIVRFTSSFKEYLYQVGSRTKFNYSLAYLDSAGKAFWKYIAPYNDNLECAPNFN
tara:strand:- start:94687 stop:95046 length:360 start_codon:yes stop_codon:yes gene_type:complete